MKIDAPLIQKIIQKIPIKYITLLLSITGVIFLYALSLSQQPIILSDLNSIDDYAGKEVTLTGTITEHITTSYGSQLITIQSNSTQLIVFSDKPLTVHSGDIFQGTGTIQEYKDTWELVLSNPKAATILSTWQNTTTHMKDLAEHPQHYLNIPLNTTGIIDHIYESIVYLRDDTGNYTIPFLPENNIIPDPGTQVSVQATLTYDATHLRYILNDCNVIPQEKTNQEG
ncbi:MAG: hypothetical protein KGY67_04485 [Candidatus Thermoplasmatota archaeon]|nr:hypothetical protein [Candidatus Thermoplasmatota archaeon]